MDVTTREDCDERNLSNEVREEQRRGVDRGQNYCWCERKEAANKGTQYLQEQHETNHKQTLMESAAGAGQPDQEFEEAESGTTGSRQRN